MTRAQASTEFIIVMGAFMVVLLVFLALGLDFLFSVRAQRDYGDAKLAVETLAAEADAAYAEGEGAERVVTVVLPPNTVFSPNATYIGRPLNSVSGKSNTIAISINSTTLTATTQAPIAGEFPTYAGTHRMLLESHGNFVSIGSSLVSASPSSVFLSMGKGETKSATITFIAEMSQSSNDSVRVSLASPWNYENVELNSISPSSFSSFGFASVPVILTFESQSGAVGIYTSELNVTAVRQAGNSSYSARQTFIVPLTVEVVSG
jgi:uncharacterized protein (UPF0333 family)